MSELCDGPSAERQDRNAEALARLYRELSKHHPDVSLPEFARLAALFIEPPPEMSESAS